MRTSSREPAARGGVAVDGQHIYWTKVAGNSAPFGGAIGRANLDGSSATPNFITGAAEPSGLAVDAAHLLGERLRLRFPERPGHGMRRRDDRARDLDGSGVDPKFTTADRGSGPGCGTDLRPGAARRRWRSRRCRTDRARCTGTTRRVERSAARRSTGTPEMSTRA